MVFSDEVAGVVYDPEVRRLAERRAGSRELAEDALHQTYWAVAQVKEPEHIRDLRAFFCKALIHEIQHQRARRILIPVEDITAIAEQRSPSPLGGNPPSVENEAASLLLAETVLHRLEHDHDALMVSVPGRSPDHRRYQITMVAAAREILLLILEGYTASADWNAVLKSTYPQWCDEPGLARDAIDQRLSRARRDVKLLLQSILPRHELCY